MFLSFLLLLFILAIFAAVFYLLLRPIINGAIYYPTTNKNVEIIERFADAKPGEKVVDLGSGDGRIVIAFAKKGIEAHGYEINPVLVLFSRWKIKKLGLQKFGFIHWESFWSVDFKNFDVLILYAFPTTMRGLIRKIKKEKRQGRRVISNIYEVSGISPLREEKKVFLYNENSFGA